MSLNTTSEPVNMQILRTLPFVALVLALIALVLAGGTSGPLLPLTIGIVVATVLVTLATLYQYVRPPLNVRQVPVENFSLWADIGEPAVELRRLSPGDVEAAVRIANADFGSLSSNAELLNSRVSLLLGRPEFGELTRERINLQTEGLSQNLRDLVKKLNAEKRFSPEVLNLIEQYATQTDRIANKLYDLQRGKPELVHIYLEPLRRAAEKLSRDLRQASANVSNFMKGVTVQSEGH